MDLIPLTLTIVTPESIPEKRGIHATTAPYGSVLAIRFDAVAVAAIDEARVLIDPSMSRSLFIKLAAHRAADALLQHIKQLKEKASGNTD